VFADFLCMVPWTATGTWLTTLTCSNYLCQFGVFGKRIPSCVRLAAVGCPAAPFFNCTSKSTNSGASDDPIAQKTSARNKSSRGRSWPNCNKDYQFYLTRMESMSIQFSGGGLERSDYLPKWKPTNEAGSASMSPGHHKFCGPRFLCPDSRDRHIGITVRSPSALAILFSSWFSEIHRCPRKRILFLLSKQCIYLRKQST
jgi:hypothetical protein